MRRPQLAIFALIIVTFVLFPAAAQACECLETGTPPCARFWRAKNVFVATAVEIYPPADKDGMYAEGTRVRLAVEEVYRGKVSKEVFDAQGGGADCKVVYEVGHRYLLYDYDFDPKTRQIATSGCSGSGELADDDEDLAYIQGLSKRKPEQNLFGRIMKQRYEPLPGVKILVEGNGKKYTALTNKDGDYKIALTKAGTYKVHAVIPFSADVLNYQGDTPYVKASATEERTVVEYEVSVPEGQCNYKEIAVFEIDLKAIAEISGKVIDVEGKPCASLTVYLYPATEGQDFSKSDYRFAQTDKDGRYVFSELRGGRYWLGVNLGRLPEIDAPYPTTYYPGVSDLTQATIINLEEGQKLSVAALRLSPRLTEREITGVILWPDGSPAVKLTPGTDSQERPVLSIYDPHRLWYSLSQRKSDGTLAKSIDDQGRFSIIGFEGYTYVIHVHAFNAKGEPIHARNVSVTINATTQPLKLVLSLPGHGEREEEIRKELNEHP